MKTYAEAVRFLYGLQKFGMKFGLNGTRALLRSVGDPQKVFPCIHIAGTNGKGSTSSMLAAIFTTAGYKTGLYTSPHLISFTERIRIDGKPMSQKDIIRLTNLVYRQVEKQKATFFEATTVMAFKYFADAEVDIAIIETGLGGRLDATNVVRPCVSVITNVSLEHTEILGKTLETIAAEKGGIIKSGIPCVTGILEPGPFRVLRAIARKRKAMLFQVTPRNVRVKKVTLNGLVADVKIGGLRYRNLRCSLAGKYQGMNLGVVLGTLDVIRERGEFSISEKHVRGGLARVQSLSGLNARLSVVRKKPLIVADVAHNGEGVRHLVDSLLDLGIKKIFLVFGVVRDKDYEMMIHELARVTMEAVITTAKTERARSLSDLVLEFSLQGVEVIKAASNVGKAVEIALSVNSQGIPLLITGSHFVVGEALSYLRSRKFT